MLIFTTITIVNILKFAIVDASTEYRTYEGFDIRSKYDGFLIQNNITNPYLLLRTSGGIYFLLDGPDDTCYHPKAYLTVTQHRDHFVAVDINRNTLFTISYNRFLFQQNIEMG